MQMTDDTSFHEHQCPGCGTWGFELTVSSSTPPHCSDCGTVIEDFDDCPTRPVELADRIDDCLTTIQDRREVADADG